MSYIIFIIKSIAFIYAFRWMTSFLSVFVDKIVESSKMLIYPALFFYTYLYGFFAAIWVTWMNGFKSGINWVLAGIFIFLTTAFWIALEQHHQENPVNNSDNAYLKERGGTGLQRMTMGILLFALIAFSYAPSWASYLYGDIPNKIVSSLFPIF